jgi:hypothetical protein
MKAATTQRCIQQLSLLFVAGSMSPAAPGHSGDDYFELQALLALNVQQGVSIKTAVLGQLI